MVSWSGFEKLTGSQQHNFETLCRSLMRLHYARFGQFAALANQPGVEFHIRLHSNCTLGSTGDWFGWQCRWYDLPKGRALGTARRMKIAQALAKTVKALPDLTDWILWTRHTLTKADQKWFYALQTKMRLHLWTSEDVETYLSGDAEILRRTYFGELVLTREALAQLHQLSIAPIKKRWLPEAHQTVDAERVIRRMLGEAGSWEELTSVANRLATAVLVIKKEPRAFTNTLSASTLSFTDVAQSVSTTLREVHNLLAKGDFEFVRQQLNTRVQSLDKGISAAPRRLRTARLPCALEATNALADIRHGLKRLDEVDRFLGTRLVAVLADAGGGKTQLAAQLTDALPDRPCGILLFGRNLHAGRSLDDLAREISIQGNPVPNIEALLAALDAAGQRERRRLPLVIDGLNEAEDPRDWKGPLAALDTLLQRFANVLVITTLRTGARRPGERPWHLHETEEPVARMDFAKQALPDDIKRLEIPGFGGDSIPAIRKYFAYFRINPLDAQIPFELLSHPLTLRIFCEVTNPDRSKEVGIEAMPGSLAALFERYIELAIRRIGELAPRTHRYYEQDIRHVLDVIGTQFWEQNDRELSETELRKEIKDDSRPWNESIVHMLEQEGVILRMPGEAGQQTIIPVYDALGGYLIANAILTKLGRDGFEPWLQQPDTLKRLDGNSVDCHPLALDIFQSLVGLVPRRLFRQQLWQLLEEPLRSTALQMAARLEGEYLDSATVSALSDYFTRDKQNLEQILPRLFETRGAASHPLNAQFLDAGLRSMEVGDRDLKWTEWVRQNRTEIQTDIQRLEERWRGNPTLRTQSDRLRVVWLMWLLVTTAHNLRDRVTRAIYWFGRGHPTALFEQTKLAADINDPYVFERMLAATYGVAMAAHTAPSSDFRKGVLPTHARDLFDLMFKENAPSRTTHVLIREYGRRLIELAALYSRKGFSRDELVRTRPPYSDGGQIAWPPLEGTEEEVHGINSPFRMDFENYVLGRLVRGRGNYDFKHTGYQHVRAKVLWRIRQLGWTAEKFSEVDRSIDAARGRYQRGEQHDKVDRYGKKYSWIANFELEGWLRDEGILNRGDGSGRTELDIDPSFPSPISEQQLISGDLLGDRKLSLADWIKNGPIPDLTRYLSQLTVLDAPGPWIMLDGQIAREDEATGRRLRADISTFLIRKSDAKAFARCLTRDSIRDGYPLDKPSHYHIFAGEVPWCDAFPKSYAEAVSLVIKRSKVKVRRRKPVFFLDGNPLDGSRLERQLNGELFAAEPALTEDELQRVTWIKRVVEVEEERQQSRKFWPLIPVFDLHWERRDVDDRAIGGVTLAKQLAIAAKLVHLPQTYDLQTEEGVRATCGIAYQPQDWNNNEQFFFIRQDILRTLLRKHKWTLVRVLWGERELSHDQILQARSDGELSDLGDGDFQVVYGNLSG